MVYSYGFLLIVQEYIQLYQESCLRRAYRIGKVKKIIHPTTIGTKNLKLAKRYLKDGYGGLVGFELKGGIKAGKKFIDSLKLFYHVANIGDARSLAIHPATTTHSQLSKEEQLASGVTEGYVRLSVGLEHIDDIVADLKQAFGSI